MHNKKNYFMEVKAIFSIFIKEHVLHEIKNTVGIYQPETGGVLGCDSSGMITHFLFDYNDESKSYKYVPSADFINKYMKDNWYDNGISFCGMVHSHPEHARELSKGDLSYAKQILESFSCLKELILVLVIVSENMALLSFYSAFINDEKIIQSRQINEGEVCIIGGNL